MLQIVELHKDIRISKAKAKSCKQNTFCKRQTGHALRLIHRNGRDCWALCWAFYAVSWNVMIVKYSRSNTRWPIRLDFSSLSIVSQQAELEWAKWMRTMRTMRWEPDLLLGALACSSDATAIMLPCGACALLSLNLGIFVASNRPLTMLDHVAVWLWRCLRWPRWLESYWSASRAGRLP